MRYLKIKGQLKRLLKHIAKEDLTSHSLDLSHFKNDPQIGKLLDTWLQFDVWHMDQSLDGDYAKATEQFIKRARLLWPEMPNTDIFQALRNVWIMIAIQILAKVPVILTDAMFAYSMLYPLTDNVIDHPDLSEKEKAAFVSQLGLRLHGLMIEPAYGIVLQLADDLQDIETDAINGHKTLFNITETSDRLAEITENLSQLSFEILDGMPTEDVDLKMQMSVLLGKSMQLLICDAIQTHEKRYSKDFYKRVNRSHIMGLKNHERLRELTQSFIKTNFDS